MTRLLVALWFAVCALLAVAVRASDRWPAWTPEIELDVGICMWAEDTSGTDWPAIGWSLVKQWRQLGGRRTFHQQVRRYCAVFSKVGPEWYGKRPALIRAATWDNPPLEPNVDPVKLRARWNKLRALVERFRDRRVADPCPKCWLWGGPKVDVIPATWTCPLGPPETKNVFCHLITQYNPRKLLQSLPIK